MKLLLCAALIANLILCACELYALGNIRAKINILKYYTFLQNFLALLVSALFSVYLFSAVFFGGAVPEFVKGLRYSATCGLAATTLIFAVFLSSNQENHLSREDFAGISPKTANFILHYFCPLLSLVSFVIFERPIPLAASQWTGYAAIPSCLYWIVYLILSAGKLWEEPYHFTAADSKKRSAFLEVLILILILLPLSFILVSILLWSIK